MIEFHKIDVGALSAISADLGTVNAGVVNGVEINSSIINAAQINSGVIQGGDVSIGAGGGFIAGPVRLDQDGLKLATGWGWSSEVAWDNNASIYGAGAGNLVCYAPAEFAIVTPGTVVSFHGGAMHTSIDLGTPVARVGDIWSQGNVYANGINIDGTMVFDADSQNAAIGRPLVVANDGIVHGVGNGYSGTSNGLVFQNGVCVGTA